MKVLSCWEAFEAYPPFYVRLFAKSDPYTLLSDAQIAIISGIDINRVREIFHKHTWRDHVYYHEILQLTAACNFDPTRAKDRARIKQYEYACKTRNMKSFRWLKKSPKYESEILPILRIAQSLRGSAAA